MLGLAKKTEVNWRISKKMFYDHLDVTTALRRSFIDQVKNVYWRNKISPGTMNLGEGKDFEEIHVFEIELTSKQLDEAVLREIDKKIEYYVLFLLEYEGLYQGWISYKTRTQDVREAIKVERYYHTDWMKEEDLPLRVDGMDIERVYENFVREISGGLLSLNKDNPDSLAASVERDERRKELERQIIVLETKVRREVQFNKQVELNRELKRKRKELEELING